MAKKYFWCVLTSNGMISGRKGNDRECDVRVGSLFFFFFLWRKSLPHMSVTMRPLFLGGPLK